MSNAVIIGSNKEFTFDRESVALERAVTDSLVPLLDSW